MNNTQRYLLEEICPTVPYEEKFKIAARVIQWLGSPVGSTFIRDILEMEYPCEKCIVQACCQGMDPDCDLRHLWLSINKIKGKK